MKKVRGSQAGDRKGPAHGARQLDTRRTATEKSPTRRNRGSIGNRRDKKRRYSKTSEVKKLSTPQSRRLNYWARGKESYLRHHDPRGLRGRIG